MLALRSTFRFMFAIWETQALGPVPAFQHYQICDGQTPAGRICPCSVPSSGHARQSAISTHILHMLLHGLHKACQLTGEDKPGTW
jgi:hypothetical protein